LRVERCQWARSGLGNGGHQTLGEPAGKGPAVGGSAGNAWVPACRSLPTPDCYGAAPQALPLKPSLPTPCAPTRRTSATRAKTSAASPSRSGLRPCVRQRRLSLPARWRRRSLARAARPTPRVSSSRHCGSARRTRQRRRHGCSWRSIRPRATSQGAAAGGLSQRPAHFMKPHNICQRPFRNPRLLHS
jgi:hypothetical protein